MKNRVYLQCILLFRLLCLSILLKSTTFAMFIIISFAMSIYSFKLVVVQGEPDRVSKYPVFVYCHGSAASRQDAVVDCVGILLRYQVCIFVCVCVCVLLSESVFVCKVCFRGDFFCRLCLRGLCTAWIRILKIQAKLTCF